MSIEDKIKQIIRANIDRDVTDADIDFSRPIKDIAFFDSLTVLNILVAIEKEFNISFDLKDIDDVFTSFNSVKDYIISKHKNKINEAQGL